MITETNDRAMTDFELSGLDPDELEYMHSDERRKALKNAGLDPDEYSLSEDA